MHFFQIIFDILMVIGIPYTGAGGLILAIYTIDSGQKTAGVIIFGSC